MHLILSFLFVILSPAVVFSHIVVAMPHLPKRTAMRPKLALAALPAAIWLVLLAALPARADWPTNVRHNLPVAVAPDTLEDFPATLALDNGRTLVVYFKGHSTHNWLCYRILDRYGNLEFPEERQLNPGLQDPGIGWPKVISDGAGGAYCAWKIYPGPNLGFYAQRLDPQGNRLWGDSGVLCFVPQNIAFPEFGLSLDGRGGLLVAGAGLNPHVQRLSSSGQLLWGPNGVLLVQDNYQQNEVVVTHDGAGGAYVAWSDWRPPYGSGHGRLYAQKLNAAGVPQWTAGGVPFFENPWIKQLLPDDAGGFLLHTGAGGPNTLMRVSPSGNIIWQQTAISWYTWAKMVAGEPGIVYIGCFYGSGVFGQRVGYNGTIYWPHSYTSPGIRIATLPPGYVHGGQEDWTYQFPYFYAAYDYRLQSQWPIYLSLQRVDSLGNQRWGENGTLATRIYRIVPEYWIEHMQVVADGNGGAAAVFSTHNIIDIFAKHVNADGSLGGPTPPVAIQPPESAQPRTLQQSGDMLSFTLPAAGQVELSLFDLLGRRVATLEDGYRAAGEHTVRFDKRGLPSGVYLLRLQAGGEVAVKKVVMVK
jgi:hypothetical protein